ncbi:hypothetical protein RHGRI_036230 [Rhododendron griersonianum]|uniref:HP domain-containing protein n=1 Tax=Rhododendron griersonianum TaxID=479676 RepID=A0AAV6HRD9_9ERIC|nr:hypothetical protein RHGRI_036230 [Rhododendron griersonianum]
MAYFSKAIDTTLLGAGAKAGVEIWCIENLQLVPVPRSSHGKFFSGSAYIILNTVLLKSGSPEHDIHYWLGKDAKEVDSALASDKALELDEALGSHTVQYREVQGQETEKFLSYFKPCIIPIEGVFSLGPGHVNTETYQVTVLTCKGDRAVHVKEFVGDPDVGEFWSLFGGYAPIPRDLASAVPEQPDISTVKLFWITTQGKLCQIETDNLSKEMLNSNKCYMLDCGAELFIWMGRSTSITERKTAISAVEDFVRSQGRSVGTHITFLTEGSETPLFRSYFDRWPQKVEPKLYEEGRGKVAAIFKQSGYDVKELPEEDCQPCIDCSGTLKVWRVNADEVSLIPVAEQMKFYSGDCYIVQYTYAGLEREENLFYAWLGCRSALGGMSIRYKRSTAEKGIPDETFDDTKTALFRVQGKSLNNMQAIQVDQVSSSLNSSYCYILKTQTSVFTWAGNLSSARDQDLVDRMLDLINVCISLFLTDLVLIPAFAQLMHLPFHLQPTWQPILVREGSEPEHLWNALGGKGEYPREKEIARFTEDPHLFTCVSTEGDFKVKEIFNFSQDDLTTEDVLVLDCHSEIYVWIGRHSTIGSKQEAFTIGLKFLETDILIEGLSLETPIYVVTEAYEPPLFTRFFDWDSSKANMIGNSFERKLAILNGRAKKMEAPLGGSWKAYSMETTPNSYRSRSVGPNGVARSISPASSVLGSRLKSSDNRRFSSPPPIPAKLFSGSSPDLGDTAKGPHAPSINTSPQVHESQDGPNLNIYPYERLKVVSSDPVTGIDVTRRETYLSDEEFQDVFKMTRSAFYQLPKWRRNKLKMSLNLF